MKTKKQNKKSERHWCSDDCSCKKQNDKQKSLEVLIKNLNFNYVNSDINDKNFPDDGRLLTDVKIFHFDKTMTSGEVINEIKKEGYVPANLREMLVWAESNWNSKDWIVAFGSVWRAWGGGRGVPCLWRGGRGRSLGLHWVDGVWGADSRFLAIHESIGHMTNQNQNKKESHLDKVKPLLASSLEEKFLESSYPGRPDLKPTPPSKSSSWEERADEREKVLNLLLEKMPREKCYHLSSVCNCAKRTLSEIKKVINSLKGEK